MQGGCGASRAVPVLRAGSPVQENAPWGRFAWVVGAGGSGVCRSRLDCLVNSAARSRCVKRQLQVGFKLWRRRLVGCLWEQTGWWVCQRRGCCLVLSASCERCVHVLCVHSSFSAGSGGCVIWICVFCSGTVSVLMVVCNVRILRRMTHCNLPVCLHHRRLC